MFPEQFQKVNLSRCTEPSIENFTNNGFTALLCTENIILENYYLELHDKTQ